jgi:hypothetical protein
MRRRRALFMPLAALRRRHSSADFTICMCECDFRQAHRIVTARNLMSSDPSHANGAFRPTGKIFSLNWHRNC